MPWTAWRAGLEVRLEPLAGLHHAQLEILDNAADGPWPGPAFLDWAAACARSLLPWMSPGSLRMEARLEPGAWVLHWPGELPLPQALHPEAPQHHPSLPGLWLHHMTPQLGIAITHGPGGLEARLPRP